MPLCPPYSKFLGNDEEVCAVVEVVVCTVQVWCMRHRLRDCLVIKHDSITGPCQGCCNPHSVHFHPVNGLKDSSVAKGMLNGLEEFSRHERIPHKPQGILTSLEQSSLASRIVISREESSLG